MRANANAIRQQPNLITAGNCRRRTRLIVAYDYAGIVFDLVLFLVSIFPFFSLRIVRSSSRRNARVGSSRARPFPFRIAGGEGKAKVLN